MKNWRCWKNPLFLLRLEMRTAALNIRVPAARAAAARQADAIAKTFPERMPGGSTGTQRDLVQRGRAILRSLPSLTEAELDQAARALRLIADLLEPLPAPLRGGSAFGDIEGAV